MRFLFLASCLHSLAACTAAPVEDASASTDAVTTTKGNVTVYEQAPIPFRLGNAVAATQNANGSWSEGTVTTETCVLGRTRSRRDDDLAPAAAVRSTDGLVPTTTTGNEFLFAPNGTGAFEPGFTLADAATYQEELRATPTRLAAFAETIIEGNTFTLEDEHRFSSGSGAECGPVYVRGFSAMRFLSFGVRLDFASESDAKAFSATFPDGAKALLADDPAPVSEFLVDRGVKVEVRVLTSIGLGAKAKSWIEADACSASDVAGCKTMLKALLVLSSEVPKLPGENASVPEVLAAGTTWGAYQLRTQSYDGLPDEPKAPEF